MLNPRLWLPLLMLPIAARAAGAPDDPRIAAVERGLLPATLIAGQPAYELEERMRHHHVPGVSIAVIEDFEIVWSRCYGVVDSEHPSPVTEQTLFNVGSLSKGVTAMGILALAREGRVDLDGDVNQWLRRWRLPESEFTREARATPRLLLNHTGGAIFSPSRSAPLDRFPTLMQLLRGESPASPPAIQVDHVPGTTYVYSNAGFTILQLLTEEATGQSFPEALRERVFLPLGMEHSWFAPPLPPELLAEAATGHARDGSVPPGGPFYPHHVAAGGLWTTALDYARFVREILRARVGLESRVLTPASAEQMLSPHATDVYGLGVFLWERQGEPWFSHMGDGPGFIGSFAAHRSAGYGAVVLANGLGGMDLVREITRAIAQTHGWEGYLPRERIAISLDDAQREAMAGRYLLGADALLTLTEDEQGLVLDTVGLEGIRLFAVAPDTLVCEERDGEIALLPMDPPQLRVRIADEVGRMVEFPLPAVKMADGERTPMEQLLDGEIEQATARYLELQRQDPQMEALAERRFNGLGYRMMNAGKLGQATALFELNAALYPQSANCHDSLGEAHMEAGRRELAIQSYERSLELDPTNENARRMLVRLRAGEE